MTPTKLLQNLGNTADEVADSLEKAGIKGYVGGSGGPCPLFVYLQTNVPNAPKWRTGGVYGLFTLAQYLGIERPLPSAISEFINKFDFYAYPNLIERQLHV